MKQLAVIFLLALGCASQVCAQTFLDRLRSKKQGEGTVTVNQSAAIDELVNNAKLTIQPKKQPTTTTQQPKEKETTEPKTAHSVAAPTKKTTSETLASEHVKTSKQPEEETKTSETVNQKKVPRVSHKITGYRVQAFSGGNSRADRQKAENVKNAIKSRFPELPVYVHFYSPRWICRVGNFKTLGEATSVLKEIKAMGYKQACIVKGKISAGY